MAPNLRRILRKSINTFIRPSGFELVRYKPSFQDYISLNETITGAKAAGVSVGEFIDSHYKVPGATQLTIDSLADLGVFSDRIRRICEIGPGSGRYLEKFIQICKPEGYEIYETAEDWRNWLVKQYQVTARNTDGNSLSQTPDLSVDLVHTHKVLYGNPIITIGRYFSEMIRITRPGGWIVFDVLTEDCLEGDFMQKWIDSGVDHACSMTSGRFATRYFESRGLIYKGGFTVPLFPAITEYFVFRKEV